MQVNLRTGVCLASLVSAGCAWVIGAEFDGALPPEAIVDASAPEHDAQTEAAPPPAADAAPPLDLRVLGPVALWLRADRGVEVDGDGGIADAAPGDPVLMWRDQSGQDRHATPIAPSWRAKLTHDGPDGKPAVWLDRSTRSCMTIAWPNAPGGVALTLFALVQGEYASLLRFQSGGAPGYLIFPFDVTANRDAGLDYRAVVRLPQSQQESVRLGAPTGRWETLTARFVADQLGGIELWRDGRRTEQGTVPGSTLPVADLVGLGCYGAGSEWANAKVAEILVYAAAITDDNRRLVESDVRRRWGLPEP